MFRVVRRVRGIDNVQRDAARRDNARGDIAHAIIACAISARDRLMFRMLRVYPQWYIVRISSLLLEPDSTDIMHDASRIKVDSSIRARMQY